MYLLIIYALENEENAKRSDQDQDSSRYLPVALSLREMIHFSSIMQLS